MSASSPFLNLPTRTEGQARADMEKARRLNDHGTAFLRQVLDGAFTRKYNPDGSYTLVPVSEVE